jgi:RimJ/RimL family protein N-acetyltransferase
MLGDLALVRDGDGTTVLTGPVADQAQLHGVLARVRDLGVPLLSLRTAERPEQDADTSQVARPALTHPVRTERLALRAGTAADAEATWEYRRLDSVGEWLTEIPTSLETYRESFTDPARLAATVIVELADGTLIGDFMLRVEDAWAQAEVADQGRGRQAELGWVLDPAHAGHGYAAEAVRALLAHCFATLGVRRVVASCFLANETSWRLMERLGMRREAHAVAESLHRSGRWLDSLGYALLAEEWSG